MSHFSTLFQKAKEVAVRVEDAAKGAGQRVSQSVEQAYETVAPSVGEAAKNVSNYAQHVYTSAEQTTAEAFDYVKAHVPTLDLNASEVVSLDEIGRKIASLGVPAIAFAVAASVAGGMGLAGGAVVTTALAMLGGPVGMVGGLVALGILTVIADAVAKYGIEAVLVSTFRARVEQGLSLEQVHQEIDNLWITEGMKQNIKSQCALS
jgi:hypothetical protein